MITAAEKKARKAARSIVKKLTGDPRIDVLLIARELTHNTPEAVEALAEPTPPRVSRKKK